MIFLLRWWTVQRKVIRNLSCLKLILRRLTIMLCGDIILKLLWWSRVVLLSGGGGL